MNSLIYRGRREMGAGIFSDIDHYFAGLVSQIEGTLNQDLYLAAAITSNLTGEGNICADLREISGKKLSDIFEMNDDDRDRKLPGVDEWRELLINSSSVGSPGHYAPLVLDDKDRLYLYRYWNYENQLSSLIKRRLGTGNEEASGSISRDDLDMLFPLPGGSADDINWQRIAAAAALSGNFTIISGGPGTGKTSTIIRILLLMLNGSKISGEKLKIALTAPTGKAAGRLKETIKQLINSAGTGGNELAALPDNVYTIHRLLSPVRGTPYFKYNIERKLPYDVVVVDECSMIDLPLMCKLLQAVPDNSSVVLLGDKDQLASIEAGAVFADICDAGNVHNYSTSLSGKIEVFTGDKLPPSRVSNGEPPVSDSLFILEKSYRFSDDSGIGILSRLVNKGDSDGAIAVLKSGKFNDIKFIDLSITKDFTNQLEARILNGYSDFVNSDTPGEALEIISSFKVLTALRKGAWGMEGINASAESVLKRNGLIKPLSRFYHRQPLLITRNDYIRMLYNGDSGIVFETGDDISAYFPSPEGSPRQINLNSIPDHETSYAMTIHKSQGSEFDNLLIIIPPYFSPVLNRELLYTAITRAKNRVEIFGSEEILIRTIQNPVKRSSGLRDSLWL